MDGDFFGDGAAQLVDSLKEAVVVEAGPDDSIKRLGERRMYGQLVLSLDEVAACGNEPRDSSDVWLRFSHSAIILFRNDVKLNMIAAQISRSQTRLSLSRPFGPMAEVGGDVLGDMTNGRNDECCKPS